MAFFWAKWRHILQEKFCERFRVASKLRRGFGVFLGELVSCFSF